MNTQPTPLQAPVPPQQPGLPDTQFLGLLNNLNTGFQQNNALVDQKNAVFDALMGNPIDENKRLNLPPDIQKVIQGGNRDQLMLQAQILNDSLNNRSASVASTIGYLTTGYDTAIKTANDQKQAAFDNLTKLASTFVDPKTGTVDVKRAGAALQGLYPGVDLSGVVSQLQGLMPVSEFNKQLQYPFEAGAASGASGSTDVTSLANSIGQRESGGNYDAQGPVVKAGAFAGDHAYGKYQVMGNNIPQWTQEALGTSMTPAEFIANPQAQDQTAQYMLNKYLAQYGNAADAASMWFTGKPAADSKGMTDVNGTKSEDYVAGVLQGIPQTSAGTTGGIAGIPAPTVMAQQLNLSPNDTVFNTAYDLVTGNQAPSQIPRRSTGAMSYTNILSMADKISQKLFHTQFNAEKADTAFAYMKSPKTSATLAFLNNTVTVLGQLKGLSKNLDRGNITFSNQAGQWLKYAGSDPSTVEFITKVNGSIDDLGAALGGGVSTDKKLDIAKSIIDPTLSDDAFQAQMNTDLGSIQSRIDAINTQAGVQSTTDSGGSGSDPLGLGI